MKKILIIESKKNISKQIVDFLQENNYEIHIIYNEFEKINYTELNSYDIILLNLEVFQEKDIEILNKIVKEGIPVIVILDKVIDDNIIKILKNGNNDYIVKPFKKTDLLTRINLRLKQDFYEMYQYKNIIIDATKKIVYKDNKKVGLRLKEYQLFLLLIKNVDNILSKREILSKVWGITVELKTRTIDYHIQQLRKKLDLKNDIITISKIGYYLRKEK